MSSARKELRINFEIVRTVHLAYNISSLSAKKRTLI